jgi:isopentenyl phosphate kinase
MNVKQNLPAVSWMSAQSVITTAGGQPHQSWLAVLTAYLHHSLLPVTSGDVVMDETQGCAIWSGETILGFLARELSRSGYKVTKLIQVGEVAGVLDQAGQVIPELTAANWAEHQSAVTSETRGFDVTGGMLLKVEESLTLAQETGIETWILAGLEPNNLLKASGESWLGTRF